MTPRISLFAVVLGLGLAAAAHAAPVGWAAAAKAYADARASGATPQTEGEHALCAGYWTEWADALSQGLLTPAELAPLPAEVQKPDAKVHAFDWLLYVEQSDEADAAVAEARGQAKALIARALAGDGQSASQVLGMLGSCRIPA